MCWPHVLYVVVGGEKYNFTITTRMDACKYHLETMDLHSHRPNTNFTRKLKQELDQVVVSCVGRPTATTYTVNHHVVDPATNSE